jgi:hypothetical protein
MCDGSKTDLKRPSGFGSLSDPLDVAGMREFVALILRRFADSIVFDHHEPAVAVVSDVVTVSLKSTSTFRRSGDADVLVRTGTA